MLAAFEPGELILGDKHATYSQVIGQTAHCGARLVPQLQLEHWRQDPAILPALELRSWGNQLGNERQAQVTRRGDVAERPYGLAMRAHARTPSSRTK